MFPFTQTKAMRVPNGKKTKTNDIIKGLQRRSRTCVEMEGISPREGNLGFNSELYSFLNSADLNPVTLNCRSDDSRRGTSWLDLWADSEDCELIPSFCDYISPASSLADVNKPSCPYSLYLDSVPSTSQVSCLYSCLKWARLPQPAGDAYQNFLWIKLFSFILLSLGISYTQKCLDICLTLEKPYLVHFSRVAGPWQPLYSLVKRFWWGFLFLGDFTILRKYVSLDY